MAAPTEEQLAEKVPELREFFFSKYADAVSGGELYDSGDVERIRNDDKLVQCYMRSFSTNLDLEEPAKQIDTVLKWRKELGLFAMTEESIPQELKDREYLYWKGVDKENHKILLLKVVKHKKGTFVEEAKKHIAFMFEQHHKVHPGERIVFIFDFSNAGVTNVDLDVVKFIISTLTNYFPSLLAYILLFEMPFLLSAVWKVIKSWLSEEQKSKITLVKKSEIQKYVAADQLEEHMIK